MGDSEIDQIFKIFRVLGTPHENNWPDALKLPDMKPSFPKFRGVPLVQHTHGLTDIELDLLRGLVALDPNRRISAKMALLHPYFDSLDRSSLPFQYDEIQY
jgi:serine/threonine protein kinase